MGPFLRQLGNKWSDHLFVLIAGIMVFLFIVFSFGGENGFVHLYQLHQMKQQIAQKNKKILLENIALTEQLKSLYQLKNIEHEARASLGYVHKDEKVFVIDNSSSPEH